MSDHGSTSDETSARGHHRSPSGRSDDRSVSSRGSARRDGITVHRTPTHSEASQRDASDKGTAASRHAPVDASRTKSGRSNYAHVSVAHVSVLELDELLPTIEDPVTQAARPLPWQPASVQVTSPRSLEACRACGVDPAQDLKKYSLKYFSRMKGEGAKDLAWRRFERAEAKRQALLDQVISVRQQIIDREEAAVADEREQLALAAAATATPERRPGDVDLDDGDQHLAHASTPRERFIDAHDRGRVDQGWVLLTEEMMAEQARQDDVAERRRALEAMEEAQRVAKLHESEMRVADATVRRREALEQKRPTVSKSSRHDEVRWRREALAQREAQTVYKSDVRLRAAAAEAERRRSLRRAVSTANAADTVPDAQRRPDGVSIARAPAGGSTPRAQRDARMEQAKRRREEIARRHSEQILRHCESTDHRIAEVAAGKAWLANDARECKHYNAAHMEEVRRRKLEIDHIAEERRHAVVADRDRRTPVRSRSPDVSSARRTRHPDDEAARVQQRRDAIDAIATAHREQSQAAREQARRQEYEERRREKVLQSEEAREREEDRRDKAVRMKRAVEYLEHRRREEIALRAL